MEVKAAICQRPPVLLDKKASMAAALAMVAEAAGQGARLMTFPEAFLPGYPTWIWRLRPGADMALGNEIHRQLQLQRNRHPHPATLIRFGTRRQNMAW